MFPRGLYRFKSEVLGDKFVDSLLAWAVLSGKHSETSLDSALAFRVSSGKKCGRVAAEVASLCDLANSSARLLIESRPKQVGVPGSAFEAPNPASYFQEVQKTSAHDCDGYDGRVRA